MKVATKSKNAWGGGTRPPVHNKNQARNALRLKWNAIVDATRLSLFSSSSANCRNSQHPPLMSSAKVRAPATARSGGSMAPPGGAGRIMGISTASRTTPATQATITTVQSRRLRARPARTPESSGVWLLMVIIENLLDGLVEESG